jgi:AcrR family transcriptional regulator
MSRAKAETWIKAGYKILAKEGLEGIKVEPIARSVHLNKSGFYHYFGSMKVYLKNLLEYHVHLAEGMAEEIATCKNVDPDLLYLITRNKSFFLVESQLLVKGRQTDWGIDADKSGKIVGESLVPLWRKATMLPEDPEVAYAYLNIILHFFYARLNSENINYEYLHALAFETTDVLNKVTGDRHVSS